MGFLRPLAKPHNGPSPVLALDTAHPTPRPVEVLNQKGSCIQKDPSSAKAGVTLRWQTWESNMGQVFLPPFPLRSLQQMLPRLGGELTGETYDWLASGLQGLPSITSACWGSGCFISPSATPIQGSRVMWSPSNVTIRQWCHTSTSRRAPAAGPCAPRP